MITSSRLSAENHGVSRPKYHRHRCSTPILVSEQENGGTSERNAHYGSVQIIFCVVGVSIQSVSRLIIVHQTSLRVEYQSSPGTRLRYASREIDERITNLSSRNVRLVYARDVQLNATPPSPPWLVNSLLANSLSSASPRLISRCGLCHDPSINIKSCKAAFHSPTGRSPYSFPKFVLAGGSQSSVAAAAVPKPVALLARQRVRHVIKSRMFVKGVHPSPRPFARDARPSRTPRPTHRAHRSGPLGRRWKRPPLRRPFALVRNCSTSFS